MSTLTIFCDGSVSKPRYGRAISAWVVYVDGKEILACAKIVEDGTERATVNVAEYCAVINALKCCTVESHDDISLVGRIECVPIKEILIKTDSKLVVQQVNREWACNDEHLRLLRDNVYYYIEIIKQWYNADVKLEWIPRELNTRSDEMSKSLHEPPLKSTRKKKKK